MRLAAARLIREQVCIWYGNLFTDEDARKARGSKRARGSRAAVMIEGTTVGQGIQHCT
jgi:hypothetical protein